MARGRVKWFNPEKGYGFIIPDGGGKDLFVHANSITHPSKEKIPLDAGQFVEYEIIEGKRGPQAANVRPLEPA